MVLGELNRLRRIAERLLVIAAAEGPEFLHLEPVALDSFTMEILRRWRPTANRRWQVGRLDQATVQADRERLGLAVDALLENAVRHTGDGDVIKLSVVAGRLGAPARMIVADAGQGIPAELLSHIFDRFRSGDSGHPRGTGLGLALVARRGPRPRRRRPGPQPPEPGQRVRAAAARAFPAARVAADRARGRTGRG